jgi:uncharacterized membrane protein
MNDEPNVTDHDKGGPEEPHGPPQRPRRGIITRLRNYLLAGVIVTAPISITLYVSWLFIDFVDRQVTPLIPAKYNPETYLPFGLPGLGLVVMVLVLTMIGAATAGFIGRFFVRSGEQLLAQMPVVRTIYSALKQVFETVFAEKSTAFREVVLIEYPRRGIWAIGFATGSTKGEVQHLVEDEVVNVFLPTTPNPTSGFLLFLPRQDVVFLNMTVEEGVKMVISAGVVTPPDTRPMAEQLKPRYALKKEKPDEPNHVD